MLATVVWIGALSTLALFIIPIGDRQLPPDTYANLLDRVIRRLDPIGWFCFAVLVGTGLFQMSGNPNYEGFLAIDNRWSLAILLKHLIFGVMIVISAIMTWQVLPRLRHASLRQARGLETSEEEKTRRQAVVLVWGNLVLSIVVLAMTALARTA
jgi:hypothetical protein